MPEKDVFSWNTMLDGLIAVGDVESSWSFFRSIPNPDVVSWNTMLSGFTRNGQIFEAKRLFDEMSEKDVFSWNTMLSGFASNGHFREAKRLFDEMPEKNVVSWNTMLDGFIAICDLESAWCLFRSIPNPDVVSWTAMLRGFASSGQILEAERLFDEMPEKDVFSCNIMIDGYAQVGQIDKAVKMFADVKERNTVTWTSLISGLTKNSLHEDVLKWFSLMTQDGKKPDEVTYSSVLRSCASIASLQVTKQVHQLALKSGYEQDLIVSSALITAYAKCGCMSSAKLIFSNVRHPDVICWSSLINAYALNGLGKEAIEHFKDMEDAGVVPDEITFLEVLSACSHTGLVDEGLSLFKCMTEKYSFEPVEEHYTCMVDLLGRAGMLDDAFELVKGVKTHGSESLWKTLLAASRLHKNLSLAKFAAEKLFESSPKDASNSKILAQAHVEAGRWDEAERIRAQLNNGCLKKGAGCSRISR